MTPTPNMCYIREDLVNYRLIKFALIGLWKYDNSCNEQC